MKTKKHKPTIDKKTGRSFSDVVGEEIYAAWVSMLKELVPGGRTHRLSVLLASMLQFAASVADYDREDDTSLATALVRATETSDPGEVEDLIHDAVVQLFEDAEVSFERTSSRGTHYSIAGDAYQEWTHWYDRPWE